MRRIVAIVLPQLACEIARSKHPNAGPLAVVLRPSGSGHDGTASGPTGSAGLETAVLDAADDEARRYGVLPGQRGSEAAVLLASLAIVSVSYGELDAALGRVAQVALAFAPTASLMLRATAVNAPRTAWGDAPFDTVWLDATGAAHLWGGEEALLAELEERIAELGHRAHLAIASGPRLAQAMARWGNEPSMARISSPRVDGDARAMAPLPVQALPLSPDIGSYLLRLGVFTIADLMRLPRAEAAARLGPRAAEILDLAAGRDNMPLLPYTPPRELVDETSFDEGIDNTEALLFVLRKMISRAAVLLASRGEACGRIEVKLALDRSIVKLHRENVVAENDGALAETDGRGESIDIHVDLPAPLTAEADLLRAVRAVLDRTDLHAPTVALSMALRHIVPAQQVQLDLSRHRGIDPDSLPALLAELSAEIGTDRVGRLSIEDGHRPESRSRLVPVLSLDQGTPSKGKSKQAMAQLSFPGAFRPNDERNAVLSPARLLPTPVSLGMVSRGSVVSIGGEPPMFALDRVQPLLKLDGIEWWTPRPVHRTYKRAFLQSGDSARRAFPARGNSKGACGDVLVYEKKSGELVLQGWYE